MAGDLATSSSGIHPGKPVIWPTGKPQAESEAVSQNQSVQTTGGVKSSVAAQTTKTSAVENIISQATTTAAPVRQAVNIARALTISDIKQHLIKLQIPDTDFNVKLASLMLKDGMEISRPNFVNLLSILRGTDKSINMQEAAIMLLMKGIDSPEALQILGTFFAENPQMASQLVAIQESMANLGNALGISQGLLDPTLVGQLGALLSQFDKAFADMNGKSKISGNNSGLLNDVRSLKALLSGIQEKTATSDSAEAQVLQSNLGSTMSKLNAVMNNLVAQALLSQKGREEVNYLYQQVPNLSQEPPKNLEIVVKREGEGSSSVIEYENTQVVMSLETMNLGKMVCSAFVKGKRVYLVFVFNEKQYGDEARNIIAKEYSELQKKLSEKNFVVSGYQVKVDPAMCAVKPYLISMLPRLGDQLKKIDLEA